MEMKLPPLRLLPVICGYDYYLLIVGRIFRNQAMAKSSFKFKMEHTLNSAQQRRIKQRMIGKDQIWLEVLRTNEDDLYSNDRDIKVCRSCRRQMKT